MYLFESYLRLHVSSEPLQQAVPVQVHGVPNTFQDRPDFLVPVFLSHMKAGIKLFFLNALQMGQCGFHFFTRSIF